MMKGKCPLFDYIEKKPNYTEEKPDEEIIENKKVFKDVGEMSPKGKELMNKATQPETKDLIKQLYRRGATIGDGGTADALRHEKETGEKIGGRNHELKAIERANQIKKILKKNPNHPDKELLKGLLDDLEDALKGGKKK